MSSPVLPSTAKAIVPRTTEDKCSALNKALLQLPLRFYQFLNWLLDSSGDFSDAARSQVWPAGALIQSAANSAPTGRWLECTGAAVVRATYPDLFTAIGTTYGEGDGSTTFNLPDLRGRAPIGAGQLLNDDATTGETYAQGDKVGSESVVLVMGNLPSEPAPIGAKMDSLFGNRNANVSGDVAIDTSVGATNNVFRANGHTDHNENVLGDLGSDTPHDNVGPRLVIRFYIAY